MPTLHILHTNDFHNHFSPAQAETVRRAKDGLNDVLLLDAGDAVSAGNVGVRPGGEPILTRMSDAGYDAMTLGNREFHVADALLRCKPGQPGAVSPSSAPTCAGRKMPARDSARRGVTSS